MFDTKLLEIRFEILELNVYGKKQDQESCLEIQHNAVSLYYQCRVAVLGAALVGRATAPLWAAKATYLNCIVRYHSQHKINVKTMDSNPRVMCTSKNKKPRIVASMIGRCGFTFRSNRACTNTEAISVLNIFAIDDFAFYFLYHFVVREILYGIVWNSGAFV